MSRLFPHLTIHRHVLLCLSVLLAVLVCIFSIFRFPITEQKRFEAFTEKMARKELSGNTLNLHYTLAFPQKYGISSHDVTLGNGNVTSRTLALTSCENTLHTLKHFRRDKLSIDGQLTYDLLLRYLTTELSAADCLLYDEPFSPTLGIQAQLPVLLAEYTFRTKGDIEDYLLLLSQIPDYFSSLISYEQSKSAAGLFMSDATAREIISQCRSFIQNPEKNCLIKMFEKKINAVSNLTADEKLGYIARSKNAVLSCVIPAYEHLIDSLSALLGTGTNEMGLSHLPNGKTYYEYLVKSKVSDDRDIPAIEEAVKQQMVQDYHDLQSLSARLPGVQDDQPGIANQTQTAKAESSSAAFTANSSDPVAMLHHLRHQIQADFPASPPVSCEVKYVDDSLKDYLSPAFYLTPPIDDFHQNVIYINPLNAYRGIELYTTLAHEGYPGHLYQTIQFQSRSPKLLRSLLSTGGYTEGWATYVEMYSYSLWPGDSDSALLYQKNRSFALGLSALLDIGIHYHGYSRSDVSTFLQKLGFPIDSVDTLYDHILQSPANYLQYYVGFLNFQSLRDEIRQKLGTQFSLKAFHTAILNAGPLPFDLLRREVFRSLNL